MRFRTLLRIRILAYARSHPVAACGGWLLSSPAHVLRELLAHQIHAHSLAHDDLPLNGGWS